MQNFSSYFEPSHPISLDGTQYVWLRFLRLQRALSRSTTTGDNQLWFFSAELKSLSAWYFGVLRKCLWNAINGTGTSLGSISLGRWWLEAFEVLCMNRIKEEVAVFPSTLHCTLPALDFGEMLQVCDSVFILRFSFFFYLYFYSLPFPHPFPKH